MRCRFMNALVVRWLSFMPMMLGFFTSSLNAPTGSVNLWLPGLW